MVLPCIAGIANSILGSIVERTKTEVTHLLNYSSNVEELRCAVKDLSDGVKSIEEQIAEADNSGLSVVDSVVKGWQEKAASLDKEATEIIRDEDRSASPTCLLGLRLNLWACYLASKKSIAAKEKAVKLREEAKTFVRVAAIDYSNTCSIIPNTDFGAFKSREIVSNNIVEALKNPNVHMVGVHGMGGLGKTTLVEKVSEQLYKDGTFKHVVMAHVSQKPDVIKIQQEIADQLRIQLDATTDKERARQLMVKLGKMEKLLIVLDDIWEAVEFNLIGIPFHNRLDQVENVGVRINKEADSHQTSFQIWYPKILMTSRNGSLLRNGMGSTSNFELQILSYNDAWNLFQNTWRTSTAGIPQDCLSIASEVVKKCSGLPILLVIVAKALRTGDLSIWKDALRQLESFDSVEFVDSDEVYKKIELSYNYLKSDEMKSLFRLFGQLDPHFTSFSDLLKYTTGLNLFKGCRRLEQVRDRLHKCLNDLKGYGLLQDVENNEEVVVRMHDVVHKFAVFVGGRDHHMLTVPKCDELEEWACKDDLEAIALRYCYLPQEPAASFHGPKLASFLMFREQHDHPLDIPDKFFLGMKGLKLMDLTRMSLSPVLPSSLTALAKLQTLCLDWCELNNISIIGELPRLQVLSLQGSSILRLPDEIGNLGQLKLMDVNNCSKLKEIASDLVLSKLTSLEELRMKKSFKYWEKEGYSSSSSTNAVFKNASLGELQNLPYLKSLDIHIPHADMFPKDYLLPVAFEKLERFRILIGEALDWSDHDFRTSRTLKLKLAEIPNQLGYGGIKALMGRAEDVYLQQLNGFESLCELDSQGFRHMKHLNVQKGVQIQYLVISIPSCVLFPKLESLVLQNLTTLQKIICCGSVDQLATAAESWVSCFENLQSLIIDGCEKISYLFVSSMVKSLSQLKRLEVSNCESMEEIFFTGGTSEEIISGEIISFPNLNIIQLKCLPNLRSFCNISNLIEFPSLTHLRIEECPELCTFTGSMEANEALFDETVAVPKLEELKISKMGGLKMIWGEALHPTSFFKLKSLAIEEGSALLTVFSSGMMSRAFNLESLIISECESLIEVFDVKTLIRENKLRGEVREAHLKTLHISDLPKLKHLWNDDTHGLVSFQNLRSVSVDECPGLTSLFPISIALALQQLEELIIDSCGEMVEIVSKKEDIFPQNFVLSNVTFLRLWRSPELKRFYPGPHTLEWPSLNKFSIYQCDKINLFGTKFESIRGEVCKDQEQLHTQVTQQPLLCLTKIMQNLEEVTLRGMDVEMIYDNDTLFLAEKVKVIVLLSFDDDSQVFPLELLQRFQNLNHLVVWLSAFKKLFPSELLADEANVKSLARLPHLTIEGLNEMTHIWDREFDGLDRILQNLESLEVEDCKHLISLAPSSALFPSLKDLVVTDCKQLAQLFTSSSTVKSLSNLTHMKISGCDSLTEIVASDHGDEATSSIKDTIVFPKLERLTLQLLANLTSFCSTGDCNFEFPSLDTIIVVKCPKMKFFCQGSLSTPMLNRLWVKPEDEEEEELHWEGDLNSTVRQLYIETVISHQRLTISSDPVLQDIWHNELPMELFSALRFLEMVECTFVTYAISSSLLRSMNNLEELRVTKNKFLEEVFDGSMELESTNGDDVLSELRVFYLVDLPSLMHVCPENLERVVDFKNLTLMDICNCSSLRYVFTASMALCLVHIRVIQVKSCAGMEVIILNSEKDDNILMIIPQLTSLLLESLPCLLSFYSGNGVLESPNLEKINITDCLKMESFTSSSREVSTNGEIQETIGNKALFNDKVAFPNLEELKVTKMYRLKMIWGNALHPSSFFKLKTLAIKQGFDLAGVFPSGMVSRTLNLESLIISECESLIEVFEINTLRSENKLPGEAQLKTLHLSDLPKLKHLWNEDPDSLISFQKLESVSVKECPSLTSLLPLSVALGLHQLKKLIIDGCKGIKEIVSKKEDVLPPKFLFSNVTFLKLWRSPELERFYPGSHTSQWPILNDLSIYDCDKIDLFGSKFQSIGGEVCKDEEQLHAQVNQQPFLCFTKIMPNLEVVFVRSMDLEMMYDKASFFFADKVRMVNLSCFHHDSPVFPIALLQRFQKLNKLFVWCSGFKQLFPSELLADEANVKTLARIPHLQIWFLNEMTHIWDGEFDGLDRILQNLEVLEIRNCEHLIKLAPPNALFPNLTYLEVIRCKQLVQVITSSSTVKSLANLTKMKIRECDSLTEIVVSDHGDEGSSNIKGPVVFPKLKLLTLQLLASLTSFCSAADCNFVFPSLVTIIVAECPKMKIFCQGSLTTPMLTRLWVKPEGQVDKKLHWEGDLNSTVRHTYIETVISHQRLTLSSDPVLHDIWHNELRAELFSALRFLEVAECTFVTYAIPSSLLRSLNNLVELRVTNNKSLEEIFDGSMELDSTNGENVLSELREFYLVDLPSLMHVFPENLERVLDFKNLTSMDICNCSSLRYVFTTSMALCLVHIQKVQVKSCAGMEAIILSKQNDDEILLILPQLRSLLLQSLHSLTSFYSGNGVLESPNLEKINITDCPKMETFTSPSREVSTNGEIQETIGNKALFNDKVAFPNLEELMITRMGGLKKIWGDALHRTSFYKLKTLVIKQGYGLAGVFPSVMLGRTLNLESLIISQCYELKEVIDIKTLMSENKLQGEVQETQLKTLHISNLPKLKHLWNEDPHGLVSFQKLESVSVQECPSLTSLIPVSVALGLHQLKELIIDGCKGIKEIVSKQEDVLPPEFLFSNVTFLKLWRSPELKRFYPGSHTSEWPILKNFSIYDCDKIDLFGSKFQSIGGEVCKDEEQLHAQVNQQPFLCFTKVMPNLEVVSLRSIDVEMLYDNASLFSADKVQEIYLLCFHHDYQVFPIELLQRFQKLNNLVVWCSGFKQLFPSELLADETNVKTLARIPHLRIRLLNEMTHIWDGEFDGLDRVLQNLEELEVDDCKHLIKLAPSTALFPNLTYLSVTECKQLVQLFTSSSTVKSLANLKNMKISKCDSLAEIVASEHGDEVTSSSKDTIVFPKLKRLTLQFLASLTSFCSRTDCNFVFPSLVTIIVAECPKMKLFCQGPLTTPQLRSLWVKPEGKVDTEVHWEGDLNSTVRKFYIETVIFHQWLRLSSDHELQDMWHDELPAELFSALRFLEVVNCTFVTYAISSSLVRSLNNLKELRVTNNKCLDEVFDGPLELDSTNGENVLSELRVFYLVDLPSLMHVCPENLERVVDFRNLTLMNIWNCSRLRYVFTTSMALCLVHIQEIQVRSCAGIEVIILNKENDEDILMILPQLTSLLLESLHSLSSFYSGNGVLESPNLEKITIIDCPKMETFTSPSREVSTNGENQETIGNKALFNDKVAFPNLEELNIRKMGGLKMIWGNTLHLTSFFKLKTLRIKQGFRLAGVFSSGMVGRTLNLESLIISECESLIEVFDVKNMREAKLRGQVQETQLKTLYLSKLPKLKHLWNEDPHGLVSFQNLESVSVDECPGLSSLFPISVALGLHQLKTLKIAGCEGMEEIVSNKEDFLPPKFVFPNVISLILRGSPKLKSFYPGSHTSEWPNLKALIIIHCDNIDLFGTKNQSIGSEVCEDEEQLHIQVNQQPFLCFTKIMPSLEHVPLRSIDMEMINEKASLFLADRVKVINVSCFYDDSQVFPFEFLQRFKNMNMLVVSYSGFKQLFPSELLVDEANVKTLARIPILEIGNLNEMTHIWDGEFDELDRILKNLEEVRVFGCNHLINLAPSNALFPNLTYLVVDGCKQLVQLITSSSTVKSLSNLKEMKISKCNSLTEIAANGEAATRNIKDTIVFPKLERLALQFLASLTSFCSRTDCNFVFPSLYQVIVAECPKMKLFCQGGLSTPMLNHLWVVKPEDDKRNEWHWEGDLNSTVKKFYVETVYEEVTSQQQLTLSNVPVLEEDVAL